VLCTRARRGWESESEKLRQWTGVYAGCVFVPLGSSLEVHAPAPSTGISAQAMLKPGLPRLDELCPFTHRASRSARWPGAYVLLSRVQNASRCARRRTHARSPSRHTSRSEILLEIRLLPLVATFPSCARPPLLPLFGTTAFCPFRGPPCMAGSARDRPLQALQSARGRGAARAERVHRPRVRQGQERARPRGARRSRGASTCFRSQDMLTDDHARQASSAALATLSAFLPPSMRLYPQTRAIAILLALLAPHLNHDAERSSHSTCILWIHARAPCSGQSSRRAPSRASACRCSSHANTSRRTLRYVVCGVPRALLSVRAQNPQT
jgi:hypothetical protein